MQFLVIGWLALEITGSSAKFGLVISLYGGPNVAFLLVAGIIADRFNRRHILIITQVSAGIIIAVLTCLYLADFVVFWHVCIASALLGTVQSLNMPARMSLVADLVPEESILDGVAMQNASQHAGRIIGPPLAGVIIDVWGLGISMAMLSFVYMISSASLTRIQHSQRYSQLNARSAVSNFKEGLAYIRDNQILFTVTVIMIGFAAFGMAHNQVLPAIAKDILGSSATEVGLLLLGSAIGAVAGNFLLPILGVKHAYRGFIASIVIFVVLLSLFAWSPWFWASWLLILGVGVCAMGFAWPLATAIAHMQSNPAVRGRVMGVLQFAPAAHFLTAYPLAFTAQRIGWGFAITGSALLCLAILIWFASLNKRATSLVNTSTPWS